MVVSRCIVGGPAGTAAAAAAALCNAFKPFLLAVTLWVLK